MPAETITTYETYTVDVQIRMQCLEMANRQEFNSSAEAVTRSALAFYDFVQSTRAIGAGLDTLVDALWDQFPDEALFFQDRSKFKAELDKAGLTLQRVTPRA